MSRSRSTQKLRNSSRNRMEEDWNNSSTHIEIIIIQEQMTKMRKQHNDEI